jgi:hypothetical protein
MSVLKQLYVRGNLKVDGNTTALESENILISDRFQVINANLKVAPNLNANSGIAMNYTSKNTITDQKILFSTVSNSIIFTSPVPIIKLGSFILVTNSLMNNGVYELENIHESNDRYVINTTPAASISNNSINDETSYNAVVSIISLSIIQTTITGSMEIGHGNTGQGLTDSFATILTSSGNMGSIFQDVKLTNHNNQIKINNGTGSITISTSDDGINGEKIYTLPTTKNTQFILTNSNQIMYNKNIFSNITVITNKNTSFKIDANTDPILLCTVPCSIVLPKISNGETDITTQGLTYKIINEIVLDGSVVINAFSGDKIENLKNIDLNETSSYISLTCVGKQWCINL